MLNTRIQIRMHLSVKQTLERFAREAGLSVSFYVNELLREHAATPASDNTSAGVERPASQPRKHGEKLASVVPTISPGTQAALARLAVRHGLSLSYYAHKVLADHVASRARDPVEAP